MESLKFIKKIIEDKKTTIYVEINLFDKAIVRPPCIILEPVKSRYKNKIKYFDFKVIFIDLEVAYNGIIEFSKKTIEIFELFENSELFEKNFEILNREIEWNIQKLDNNIEYYSAIANYSIDETKIIKEELEFNFGSNLNLELI